LDSAQRPANRAASSPEEVRDRLRDLFGAREPRRVQWRSRPERLDPQVVNSWSTDSTALGGSRTRLHRRGTPCITGISGQGCTQRHSARRPHNPWVAGSSPAAPIESSPAMGFPCSLACPTCSPGAYLGAHLGSGGRRALMTLGEHRDGPRDALIPDRRPCRWQEMTRRRCRLRPASARAFVRRCSAV
jgi:hypothetical protein